MVSPQFSPPSKFNDAKRTYQQGRLSENLQAFFFLELYGKCVAETCYMSL